MQSFLKYEISEKGYENLSHIETLGCRCLSLQLTDELLDLNSNRFKVRTAAVQKYVILSLS